MCFDVVYYCGVGRRRGQAAVYFEGHPCCPRIGPLSRKEADRLRERVLRVGDNALLVGLVVEGLRDAIKQGVSHG